MTRMVRFRSLGCWPLTGAIESTRPTCEEIVAEMLHVRVSERGGRLIDRDESRHDGEEEARGLFLMNAPLENVPGRPGEYRPAAFPHLRQRR